MRWTRILTAALWTLLAASRAAAQGCAMCYSSAAAQGPEAAHGMNLGILILLFPTLLLFGGVLTAAVRRRAADAEDFPDEPAENL